MENATEHFIHSIFSGKVHTACFSSLWLEKKKDNF